MGCAGSPQAAGSKAGSHGYVVQQCLVKDAAAQQHLCLKRPTPSLQERWVKGTHGKKVEVNVERRFPYIKYKWNNADTFKDTSQKYGFTALAWRNIQLNMKFAILFLFYYSF